MTADPLVLGIDLGTSSVKVALADATGGLLDQATQAYPVDRPRPGWAQTDPQAWWDAVLRAVGRLDLTGRRVAGIGLSGQMHGVVLCRGDLTPTRPAVLWCDVRAEAQLAAYRELPDANKARLGNPLSAGMAGPQLAWLHQHEPTVVAASRWALQPKDWIRARLTGHVAAEPSDASATLLFDVLAQAWDDDVVDALGVHRHLLADLVPYAGTTAGHLADPAAAELGLVAGVPVAAGAADTAAAALGSGLLRPGRTQLTIGTGLQIVRVVDPPQPGLPADPVTHLYRDATPTGWYAMAASLSGGQALEWVRTVLGAGWAELYAAADRQPRPDDPVFVPHLVGERTPYLDTRLRGSWTGLAADHTRTDLLYAAVEGVAFAAADAFAALPETDRDEALLLAGGGTTAPAWRALLADVLDRPLDAVDVPGASVLGACVLGAVAAGLITVAELAHDQPAAARVADPGPRVDLLAPRLDRYRQVVSRLRPSG